MNATNYLAPWTAHTAALQTSAVGAFRSCELSLGQRVSLAFRRGLQTLAATALFPLKWLARSMTLPTTQIPSKEWKVVNQKWEEKWQSRSSVYKPIPLELKTADGAQIQATHYFRKAGAPTIVCFNHNRCLSKSDGWDWLIAAGEKSSEPFNVITFDYRGTGQEGSVHRTNELIIDGETVVQYALDHLGVSPKNIRYLGFSIGGGVSARVAVNHPETGRVVNRSSFSSLGQVLQHSPEIDDTVPPVLFPFVPKFLLPLFWNRVTKWVTAKLNAAIGWELDAAPALRALKDRVLIAYHPADRLIPPPVGAVSAVGKEAIQMPMKLKPGVVVDSKFDYHLAAWDLLQDATGGDASKRVLDFLLQS